MCPSIIEDMTPIHSLNSVSNFSVAMATLCAPLASITCWPTRGYGTSPPRVPTAAWTSPRPSPPGTWRSRRRSRSCLRSASTARKCSRATRFSTTRRRHARIGNALADISDKVITWNRHNIMIIILP